MNPDAFNMSIRKFLKMVGVHSQREIEAAVEQAVASGKLKGNETLAAKMTPHPGRHGPRRELRRQDHARVNDATTGIGVDYGRHRGGGRRLEGVAHRTPVATSPAIRRPGGLRRHSSSARTCSAWAPSSSAAPTTRSSRLDARQRAAGVVAFSSGNHAQAVALAGRLLGIPATIVMPADAPAVKVAATRGYGAEVVFYDRAAGRAARKWPRASRARRAPR